MVPAAFTFCRLGVHPRGAAHGVVAAGPGVTETDAGLPPLIIRAFLAFVRFFA